MTSELMDVVPSLYGVAEARTRAWRAVARERTRAASSRSVHGLRSWGLSVSGLGCLVASAWTWHTWAGLACAGLSLLALEIKAEATGRSR